MKKHNWLILFSLLVSLFIYTFYRTEKTVINEIFISIFSRAKYLHLKSFITNSWPLNAHIVYSLPEGLWVFCITLTSKYLFLKIGDLEINCVFVPLLFSIGLELFQLFHYTNGRFDFWDIGMSVVFWGIANYLVKYQPVNQNILQPITHRSVGCFLSYGIVYLAHVWQ